MPLVTVCEAAVSSSGSARLFHRRASLCTRALIELNPLPRAEPSIAAKGYGRGECLMDIAECLTSPSCMCAFAALIARIDWIHMPGKHIPTMHTDLYMNDVIVLLPS